MELIPPKHPKKHAYPSFLKLCLQFQQILLLTYPSQIDRMYVLMPWPDNYKVFLNQIEFLMSQNYEREYNMEIIAL